MRPMALYVSHCISCVPWHFMRPMAFYASHQHFMRPMAFYASHGILCVNESFINTEKLMCIFLDYTPMQIAWIKNCCYFCEKAPIHTYFQAPIPIKWAKTIHWKFCTVCSCSIRHSFFIAAIVAFKNIVQ